MRICVACALKSDQKDFEIDNLISDGEDVACESKLHTKPNIIDPPSLTALPP